MTLFKNFAVAACLALATAAPSFAGRIVTETIPSSILGEGVTCNVYLPDGYDSSRTYPVIYLLHGLYGTYKDWMTAGRMKDVADELIASGECLPAVIVMPNAGGPDTAVTWNGYFNMPGWNYEDFFFTELVPQLEAKFNAGGSKGMRAVMGLSMGGGGSVVYCQRHPEMFSSCYAMSPWLDNKGDKVGKHKAKDKLYLVCESVCEHSAVDFVRNADDATVEKLRTVKWFVDCGDDDFLFDFSVQFHQEMRARKIKNELRIRNGVHNWEYWHLALRMALPFASSNFTSE